MEAATAAASRPDNAALARALRELAARLDLDGVAHSPRAYRRAADTVERERESLAARYDREGEAGLEALRGIGPYIAKTLRELLETGTSRRLERLRRKAPVDVLGLLAIDGIGPKRLRTLWQHLHVATVKDLEHALDEGRVRALPGFGSASEERLRRVLRLHRDGVHRVPLREAAALADGLRRELEAHPSIERCVVAGSIRRRQDTVGDIDLVAVSDDAPAAAAALLARPDLDMVYSRGPQRVSVALASGIDVDLRIVPRESFGSALLYFTGSRAHTLALRQLALAQGLRLNEYGLYRGEARIAGQTEEEIYAALSLPYLDPTERRGSAEIHDALHREREGAR